jgi:hypothetical protein
MEELAPAIPGPVRELEVGSLLSWLFGEAVSTALKETVLMKKTKKKGKKIADGASLDKLL